MKSRIAIPAAVCLAVATAATAQDYSPDWYTIDGGGGTSSGGTYTLSGTIGQADAGTMRGGPYTLEGGFWSVLAAVQMPDAPELAIALNLAGDVLLLWDDPSTGFILQETSAILSPPSSMLWTEVTATPVVEDGRRMVTIPAPAGNRLYRLVKPAP